MHFYVLRHPLGSRAHAFLCGHQTDPQRAKKTLLQTPEFFSSCWKNGGCYLPAAGRNYAMYLGARTAISSLGVLGWGHESERLYGNAYRLDAVRLDAVRLDAVRLDAARVDAVRLDAVGLDAVRWMQLGWMQLGWMHFFLAPDRTRPSPQPSSR